MAVRRGTGRRKPPWTESGDYRVLLRTEDRPIACRSFSVKVRRRPAGQAAGTWTTGRSWDRSSERLYSAWIEQLFGAPEGTRWQGFHQLTRDRSRNLLHGHLRLGEDDAKSGLAMDPDCADAPYTFRAYFAWKLGLPFGRHECRFGSRSGPPECGFFRTNEDRPETTADRTAAAAAAAKRACEARSSPAAFAIRRVGARAQGRHPRSQLAHRSRR